MADLASVTLKLQVALTEAQQAAVVVSSPLSDLAANTARNVGPYWNDDPQWNNNRLSAVNNTDYSGMCIDLVGNRILKFGGAGHGPSQENDLRQLDLSTLKWSSLYPSTPVTDMIAANLNSDKGCWKDMNPFCRHTYNMTLVRGRDFQMLMPLGMPDGYFLNVDGIGSAQGQAWGGRNCSYNFDTKQWKYGQWGSPLLTPQAPWYYASAACLDPHSNKILIIGMGPWSGPGGLWLYDPDSDSVTKLLDVDVGGSPALVYFPPTDKFYALQSDGQVWEINVTAPSVTKLTVTGTPPTSGNGFICGYAYDSVNQIIGGNVFRNTFYAFDPLTKIWTATQVIPEDKTSIVNMVFHNLVFDPKSGCFIFLDTPAYQTPGVYTTWAFRFDKKTAKVPMPPVTPNNEALQTLVDQGGTINLGDGELMDGAVITKAGTIINGGTNGGTQLDGGAEVWGKGILVVEVDATINGITFYKTDPKSTIGNAAGIRHDKGNLKVNGCTFVECQDGYLGNDNVAFDGCVFKDCGFGDGQTHAVYVSNGPTLATANNCSFEGTKIGHHFKSRAAKSVVTNSVFQAATESYSLDFPWGGDVTIDFCMIVQGPDTDNAIMVRFGEESYAFTTNTLTIKNTHFASSGVPSAVAISVANDPNHPVTVVIDSCSFTGMPTVFQGGPNVTVTYTNCTKEGVPFNG